MYNNKTLFVLRTCTGRQAYKSNIGLFVKFKTILQAAAFNKLRILL